jgi:hypothetical protein
LTRIEFQKSASGRNRWSAELNRLSTCDHVLPEGKPVSIIDPNHHPISHPITDHSNSEPCEHDHHRTLRLLEDKDSQAAKTVIRVSIY